MKKKILLYLYIAVTFLFISCSANIPPQYHPQEANGKIQVIVHYFDLEKWNSNYQGDINFQKKVAEYIAGNLQNKGIAAIAIPSQHEPSNNARYIIQGKIRRMDVGSWAGRFWVGFGVGAGKFAVKATLTDVASGAAIDEFNDLRSCGLLNGDDGILECGCIETSEDVVNKFLKYL